MGGQIESGARPVHRKKMLGLWLGIVTAAFPVLSWAQPSSRPAPPLPAEADEETAEEKEAAHWRERFDKVYCLNDGEVLKRVAPPWIPERSIYQRHYSPGDWARSRPRAPDLWQFDWTDRPRPVWSGSRTHLATEKLRSGQMGFGRKSSLQDVLDMIGLARFEYDASGELLSQTLPGDWIIREGASREALLAALEKIVRTEWEEPVHFVRRQADRPVIVARGRFKFHRHEDVPEGRQTILMFREHFRNARRTPPGRRGTMKEFLMWASEQLGRQILDETEPLRPDQVEWESASEHWVANLPEDEEKPEMINNILQILQKQTSLTFKQETRKADVWFVVQGSASQPASSAAAP